MDNSKRNVVLKHVETAPVFYANSVQLSVSPFDFRLILGTLEIADAEQLVTKVQSIVYMSPQHAKILAEILTTHVQKYESLYGTINRIDVQEIAE